MIAQSVRLLAGSVFLIFLPCLAAPVYINGVGGQAGNNPFSFASAFVAQDFILPSNTALTSLSFNAFTTGVTVPITNVNVKMYADDAGAVGSLLYSGAFPVASEAVTGANGYTLKDFFVNLPGWNLGAGHYWLALRVDPPQWDMHWSIPVWETIGYGSYISYGSGAPGSFVPYGNEHSFALYGGEGEPNAIPEPSTAVLSMTALAFAALFARFRRR